MSKSTILVAGMFLIVWGSTKASEPNETPRESGLGGASTDGAKEFKVFQFPRDRMPRIDGDASDWKIVPSDYAVTNVDMRDTLRGTQADKGNLDVSVKVGWVKGLNRLYFLYQSYDDYWDFSVSGMHNDIFEVIIDGNMSGGALTPLASPDHEYKTWKGHLMHGVHAQNYHVFTPAVGKRWAMLWGCQSWALDFPWSNASSSSELTHGKDGHYTLEFWITPFDYAPCFGPEGATATNLSEGQDIGLSWVVLDYDNENSGHNGYRSFFNLSNSTEVHSNADFLRKFRLMPIAQNLKPALKASWSYQVLNYQQRKVQFFDESIGAERWTWDFGDGNVSEERNPVHVYSEGGFDIVVRLTVEGKGMKDSLERVWEFSLPE